MKYKKEFKEAHPETIGETDTAFDMSNYIEWIDAEYEKLISKAENLPVSGVSSRRVLGFNSCASVVKSMPMDQAIQMIKSDITGKPQTSQIEGELVVTLM